MSLPSLPTSLCPWQAVICMVEQTARVYWCAGPIWVVYFLLVIVKAFSLVIDSFFFVHGLIGAQKALDALSGISSPVCSLAKFYEPSLTPSPGNSSIWRAQETAENHRFSQKTEYFRRKPQETADWAPSP